MKVRVELDRLAAEAMFRDMEALGDAAIEPAQDVLSAFADGVVLEAKREVPDDPETPFRLGETIRRLKARATRARGGAKRVEVTVVAGGRRLLKYLRKRRVPEQSLSAWVLRQHEDMRLRHAKGRAKFLERPFFNRARGALRGLESAMDRAVRRHGSRG